MSHKAGILFGTLTIAFLFLFSVACFDVSGDSSGTHGNLDWKYDNDGKLTITGSESMNDLINEYAEKWGNNDIRSVEIGEGVTSIGRYTFTNLKNLESVAIPNSVKSIDAHAFFHCTSLKSIEIPDSVKTIGDSTFNNCVSLKSIDIPKSAKIGKDALDGCTVVPWIYHISMKTIDEASLKAVRTRRWCGSTDNSISTDKELILKFNHGGTDYELWMYPEFEKEIKSL